ncbi:MAG: acyltransferase 3 [Verrucomicrobiales bacterium]|nr:acyltransferase 3 [Verrucomicrobiales bacterium]
MSGSTPQSLNSERIPELDGLRGCAIIMVVAFHYLMVFHNPEILGPYGWIWKMGWSGVDLFFVLSGFLIGGILFDQSDSENFFKVFFVRRICRIFPLYFFFVAVFFLCIAIWPVLQVDKPLIECFERVVPYWSYFAFLQNLFVAKIGIVDNEWMRGTWSLAVEEQFYLTLPFMIRFIPRRRLALALLVLAILVPVLRYFVYLTYGDLADYVLLPCRADTLIGGVLCAYAIRDETIRRYLATRVLRASGGVLLAGTVYLWLEGEWQGSFEMFTIGYSWLAMFYSWLLLMVLTNQNHFLSRFLRLGLLRKLGTISFGIYLFHVPVNSLWHGLWLKRDSYIHTPTDMLATFFALVSTLLLAWCSWRFFEKPIVDFGRRFKYTKAAPIPVSSISLATTEP